MRVRERWGDSIKEEKIKIERKAKKMTESDRKTEKIREKNRDRTIEKSGWKRRGRGLKVA